MKFVKNIYSPNKKSVKGFEIVESSKMRITPSIDQYVQALESASSRIVQQRIPLYDNYYQTLMIDDVVSSLIEKRLDNINNKKIQCFTKEGELVDEVNIFLDSPKFLEFTKDLLMVQFFGFSLFEFDEMEWDGLKLFDYKKIPIKHINPYKKHVLKTQYDEFGMSFENLPDYLFLGDPDDLGLLSKVTYLSILNRMGTFNYSNYVDLASNNFMMIKSRVMVDDEEVDQLQLEYMKSSNKGSIAVPDGVDVDFENQSSSQQNALFKEYSELIRERLSILILGQTMTTMDGSSRSQSQVHEKEQTKKYTKDEVFVENVMNYEFKDYLNIWFSNINTEKLYFKFVPNTDDEIAEKLENFEKLKNLGVIFTDEELRNHFQDLIK